MSHFQDSTKRFAGKTTFFFLTLMQVAISVALPPQALAGQAFITESQTWKPPTHVKEFTVKCSGGGGGYGGDSSMGSQSSGGGAGGLPGTVTKTLKADGVVQIEIGRPGRGGMIKGQDGGATRFGKDVVAGGGQGGYAGSLPAFDAEAKKSCGIVQNEMSFTEFSARLSQTIERGPSNGSAETKTSVGRSGAPGYCEITWTDGPFEGVGV